MNGFPATTPRRGGAFLKFEPAVVAGSAQSHLDTHASARNAEQRPSTTKKLSLLHSMLPRRGRSGSGVGVPNLTISSSSASDPFPVKRSRGHRSAASTTPGIDSGCPPKKFLPDGGADTGTAAVSPDRRENRLSSDAVTIRMSDIGSAALPGGEDGSGGDDCPGIVARAERGGTVSVTFGRQDVSREVSLSVSPVVSTGGVGEDATTRGAKIHTLLYKPGGAIQNADITVSASACFF